MNDLALEGNFVWSSGEPLVYTNWASTQPDNAGPGGEDYAHIWNLTGQEGTWNDTGNTNWPGNGDLPYGVVEVIPEPATLGLLIMGGLALFRRRSR